MVYESRVGDVFTLGSSAWRIEEITHDRVLVTPAPGQPGKLPFWHGDALGRPAELGRAVGAFLREVPSCPTTPPEPGRAARASTTGRATTSSATSASSRRPPGTCPTTAPWWSSGSATSWATGGWSCTPPSAARCTRRGRSPSRHGSASASASTSRRCTATTGSSCACPTSRPTTGGHPTSASSSCSTRPMSRTSSPTSSAVRPCSPHASASARRAPCCCRGARPGKRQPLWQQRQRAAQLLQVASRYGSFPIVLETVRECLQDVFDVPGLVALMRDVQARSVRLVEVETQQPSPFARSLLFGYVAQFLYEGDAPLAERRAAALALDPGLLAELLGRGEGPRCATCSTRRRSSRTENELQRLAPERRLRGLEGAADLLRLLGPLDTSEVAARTRVAADDEEPAPLAVAAGWLEALEASRRSIRVRIAGSERWAAVEDAGRLQDALGTPLPVGVAEAFTEPVPDPLGDLLARYARTHGPFTAAGAAARFGLGSAVVTEALRRLAAGGRLVEGELRPLEAGGVEGLDWCDAEVLRTIRRRSLAALRAEVEPVPARDLARFLPSWQGVGAPVRGVDGVAPRGRAARRGGRARQRAGDARAPGTGARLHPGPARRADRGRRDRVVRARCPARRRRLGRPAPGRPRAADPPRARHRLRRRGGGHELHRAVLDVLAGGGAYFFRPLADAVGAPSAPRTTRLSSPRCGTSSGRACSPTTRSRRCAPGSRGGRTAHRSRPSAPRARYGGRPSGLRSGLRGGGLARPVLPSRGGPPTGAGRWSLLPAREQDATCGRTPSRSSCSNGTAWSPAEPRSPSASPAASPPPTACWRPSRTRAGCVAATSSRASAPRSSPRPAPSTGCGRRPVSPATNPTPRSRGAPPWCSPQPTPPTRTARPCPGPTGPTGRPGRRAGAADAQAGPQGRRPGGARRRRAGAVRGAGWPVAALVDRRPGRPAGGGRRAGAGRPRRGARAVSPWSAPTGRGCSPPSIPSPSRWRRPGSTRPAGVAHPSLTSRPDASARPGVLRPAEAVRASCRCGGRAGQVQQQVRGARTRPRHPAFCGARPEALKAPSNMPRPPDPPLWCTVGGCPRVTSPGASRVGCTPPSRDAC